MDTEAALLKIIAKRPKREWHTRLLLADLYQERGDSRSEGLRVRALLRLYPFHHKLRSKAWAWWYTETGKCTGCYLTPSWYVFIQRDFLAAVGVTGGVRWRSWWQAENAADLAFAALPEEKKRPVYKMAGVLTS